MKTRFIKAALIAAAAMTMVFGATMVANAEELSVKPRLSSNCNNVNCQGHVSVYNGGSGLNLHYCVPDSWTGSFDEFRTEAEAFFAKESGVEAPVEYKVSAISKDFDSVANITAAPVDSYDVVAYAANHMNFKDCNNMNCKGHVYAKDPVTGMDSPYCVPATWTPSLNEFQAKLQEYINIKYEAENAPAEEPAVEEPTAVLYTVVKGDTLSKIAKACYGDSKYWVNIYECNKDTIKNPNKISIGQVIVLPVSITEAQEAAAEAAVVEEIVEAIKAEVEAEAAPVAEEAPIVPIVDDAVSKEYYDVLEAMIENAVMAHNYVVDAVDAGQRPMTEAAMDYLDTATDALNEIASYTASDYTVGQAICMYYALADYCNSLVTLQ